MQDTNAIKETAKRIGNTVTFKLITICALILVLLVPTSMVTSLIHERKGRKQGVAGLLGRGLSALHIIRRALYACTIFIDKGLRIFYFARRVYALLRDL